jgi:hypothetical protein
LTAGFFNSVAKMMILLLFVIDFFYFIFISNSLRDLSGNRGFWAGRVVIQEMRRIKMKIIVFFLIFIFNSLRDLSGNGGFWAGKNITQKR